MLPNTFWIKSSILLFLPLGLWGASLEMLINNATSTHTSLQVIEQKLSLLDDEIDISKNFTNPELSLSMSDIQLDNPTKRSLEPMQFTSVNFKQKLPYFGKIDAKSEQIKAKKQTTFFSLEEAKVQLVRSIKITAYTIWEIEQELKITNEYIKLTHQNIELYTAYSSSDANSHMSTLSAELSLSQLKIKKSNLEGLLNGLYKKVSYLSAMDVQSIELDSKIDKPSSIESYLESSDENSAYKRKVSKVQESLANTKIQELSSFIDPVIQAGYYRREGFKDYVNIGVGFSLPLYGTEDSKEQIARKLTLAYKSEVSDFKNKVTSKIHLLYAQLEDSYRVYNIIQNESLPQIEHMFDLSSSAIKNGADLFIFIDMLERKLMLDEQSIKAVASFHKTLASLEALIGVQK